MISVKYDSYEFSNSDLAYFHRRFERFLSTILRETLVREDFFQDILYRRLPAFIMCH